MQYRAHSLRDVNQVAETEIMCCQDADENIAVHRVENELDFKPFW